MGRLKIDLVNCTGCRMCEIWCSVIHEHAVNPKKSRIRVVLNGLPEQPVPVVCQQCKNASCADACPLKAISYHEKSGAWVVDEKRCNGCGLCVEACPFGAITLHPERNVAIKCDLCGGNPQCVAYCQRNFLTYSPGGERVKELNELAEQKREAFAAKKLGRMLASWGIQSED
ncbi:4Fe-4S dicluster domain-containing protein [Neomoorella mulderi]|uniref:Putative ferredoxin-like protein YdhY n=1 Tax=Moorella mulderi DSM 14980 TaxID=1122241 RepID=A0A151AVW8_9FIRM|nr:4Fe-4S dicluster domain-containing protein [Moorella mulderi]KYH31795.1 putative ferredoxin-like protein YdhY [Moorella mulderi DSM 14980]